MTFEVGEVERHKSYDALRDDAGFKELMTGR
jgi:hypothetical protein